MAGPLTWREVTAPNFAGVAASQRNAADLLNQAATGLIGTLNDYEQAPLIRELSALAVAIQQENLDNTQYTNQRTRAQDRATDRAAPLLNEMSIRALNGDLAGAQTIGQQNLEALGQLSPSALLARMTEQQSLATGTQNFMNTTETRQRERRDREDSQVVDDVLTQVIRNSGGDPSAATFQAERFMRGLTPSQQNLLMNRVRQQVPGTYGADINLSGYGSPAEAVVAEAATGQTGGAVPPMLARQGAPGTRTGNPYSTAFGHQELPFDPVNTGIGQVVQYQRANFQRGTPQAGSPAIGAYQFKPDTLEELAKAEFGDNWQNTAMTPQVQERLAERLFNQRKNGDLSKTWAVLENVPGGNQRGRFKDVSWNQMRGMLAGPESGRSMTEVDAALSQAGTGTQAQNLIGMASGNGFQVTPTAFGSGNQVDSFLQSVLDQGFNRDVALRNQIAEGSFNDPVLANASEWMRDTTTTPAIAAREVMDYFGGESATKETLGAWQDKISQVQRRYAELFRGNALSPKMAAEVLKNSVTERSQFNPNRYLLTRDKISDSLIDENLRKLSPNDIMTMEGRRQNTEALGAERTAQQAKVEAARTRYENLISQVQAMPSRAPQAQAAARQLAAEIAKLNALTNQSSRIPLNSSPQ